MRSAWRATIAGLVTSSVWLMPWSTGAFAHFSTETAGGVAFNFNKNCVRYDHLQNHNSVVASTFSRQTSDPPVEAECGKQLPRNAGQIGNFVRIYKNGNGNGGFDCTADLGWAVNAENGVSGIRREWNGGANTGLQEFCGFGGLYTIDAEHRVVFDGAGEQGGILRAVTFHDYK